MKYLDADQSLLGNSFTEACDVIASTYYTGQVYSQFDGFPIRNCTFEFATQWKARLDLAGVLEYPEYVTKWTHDETSAPDLPRPAS